MTFRELIAKLDANACCSAGVNASTQN